MGHNFPLTPLFRQDPVTWLAVIGLSLKAVQDFYSNSNWVELHPRANCSCFNAQTYTTVANSVDAFSDSKYTHLRTGL